MNVRNRKSSLRLFRRNLDEIVNVEIPPQALQTESSASN